MYIFSYLHFIVSRRNLRLTNIQERYPKLLFQVIESETLSSLRNKLKQTSDIVVEKVDEKVIVFYSDEDFEQENLLEFSENENIFVFTFENREISIQK